MKREKGQALIETAIVLPLLLVLFFGIVDFGRALYAKNSLSSAAGLAARTAVVSPSMSTASASLASAKQSTSGCSAPATAVSQNLPSIIDQTKVTYAQAVTDASGKTVTGAATPGNNVHVTLTCTNFSMLVPLGGLVAIMTSTKSQGYNSLTLTGEATMRYE